MTPPLESMALFSFIILSAHGQLSVIWNSTAITGPVLIYLDEILVDHYSNATIGDLQREGALICQSKNSGQVSWHFTDGVIVSRAPISQSRGFIQTRTGEGVIPAASRLSTSSADAPMNTGDQFNGVWHCRLNAQGTTAYDQQVNVDIFSRGGGRGTIRFTAANSVTLRFPSFTSSPPTFTLYADTIGGPPTHYNWTRNGQVITQGGPYSISTVVNGFSNGVFSESLYRSTLNVTGYLAGVYTYSVTNRATSTILTSNFTIEGAVPPATISAMQDGVLSVLVSWTAPSPLPTLGYLVTAQPGNTSVAATMNETSKSIIVQEGGMYEVKVTSRSRHLPSDEVKREVIVKATKAPIATIISINAASATVLWTQPQYSFSPVSFTVMLTRITGTQQILCADVTDTRTSVNITASTTRMELTSLHEYSTYNVTVTALFSVFNSSMLSPEFALFNTSKAAPTGAPQEFNFSTTSRSATVSWGVVECIQRNGEITGYRVELHDQDQGGAKIVEETMSQTFTASELTPHTNYTFRVAARNSEGVGPFSDNTTITTQQDVPGPVSNLRVEVILTSIVLCWSAPQESNGDIIAYEVTYSINESHIMSENTSDVSTTHTVEVFLNTNASEISVRAYTPIGPGNVTEFDASQPIPVVEEIEVEVLTPTSVNVSWESITDYEIVRYTVYYSPLLENEEEQFQTSVGNSVVISNLMPDMQYQFWVIASVTLEGITFSERSELAEFTSVLPTTSQSTLQQTSSKTSQSSSGTSKTPSTTDNTLSSSSPSSPSSAIVGSVMVLTIAVLVITTVVVIVLVYCAKKRILKFSKLEKNLQSADMLMSDCGVVIEKFPCDTSAVEGEGVVFRVVVRGNPEPSLTWYHDNTPLVPDYSLDIQQDGSLTISSSELKHNGMYKLLAKNSRGSTEREVRLTVAQEVEETDATAQERKPILPVPVAEFGDYVAKNHADSDQIFRSQFESLDTGDEHPKTIGTNPSNSKLNRFANITVYDHNRVVLKPLEGHEECQDFINACYIDGYSMPNRFIATQGPKQHMLVDFWRLIWQERPSTIVMVTNLKEGYKSKCEQYWPEKEMSTFGPFKISFIEQQVYSNYSVRTLLLSLESCSSEEPVEIKQFHYTSWPDHGVPEYATTMLSFHKQVVSHHSTSRGPMLVHCSAGVGRTGTFICLDSVLEQIKKEEVVDIAGTINKMRHQRMKMVQTLDQYIFIHDAILESVTCGNTEIKSADLKSFLQKINDETTEAGVSMLLSQFKVLEQLSPKQSEAVCSAALQNPDRNRSSNHLPSDKHRALLSGEHPDYIHAVAANGYKQKKVYIIAEGPMESTARNMWKMVHDRNCVAIVMLSDLIENEMESSWQYWPSSVGDIIQLGEYKVDLTDEETLEGFTIRTLTVLNTKSKKSQQVTQFQITCWSPDGVCSNLRSVVDVIEELAKVQRKAGNQRVFVHCNDTVTRSGMFCAMMTVVERCKTEGVVDVFQVVKALRIQKPEAVPTLDNYKTIYDAALSFLDSFDTYANFQDV